MKKEKIKENFRKIGDKVWYHMEDIGVLHPNGSLSILEFKISWNWVEVSTANQFSSIQWSVEFSVTCSPVVFVQVNREEILEFTKKQQILGDIEILCNNEKINSLLLQCSFSSFSLNYRSSFHLNNCFLSHVCSFYLIFNYNLVFHFKPHQPTLHTSINQTHFIELNIIFNSHTFFKYLSSVSTKVWINFKIVNSFSS